MKKDRILETAARLFAERGFSRTSTNLLAREAGVAEGTIFRHFTSKEEIFLQIVGSLRERLAADVARRLEEQKPATGLERITTIIKACHSFVRKNRNEFAALLRDAPGDVGGLSFERSRAVHQLLQQHFGAGIELGQRQGCVRASLHPGDTACLLVSALVGLMRVAHLGLLRPSEDMLRHFVQCVEAMLAA